MNYQSIALKVATIFLVSPSFVVAEGNIRVSVSGGNLLMVGALDATGQAFKIAPTGVRDQYNLQGLADTTLNGRPTLIVSGITNNIDIKMHSIESVIILSNDGVSESLDINGNLKITSTSQESTVVILDSVFCYQTLSITTGAGKDTVINGDSVFKWKASVRMGSGDDNYYSIGCGTNEMFVDGGTGADFLLVEDNLFSRNTVLRGQPGNDYLGIVSTSPYELCEIFGGAGMDQFTFEGPSLATLDSADAFGGRLGDLLTMAAESRPIFSISYFLWAFLP